MVATRWTPYEITLTPIPADPSVGIGRDLTRSLDGIAIATLNGRKETDMTQKMVDAVVKEIRSREQKQSALIGYSNIIGPEAAEWTRQAIQEGKSLDVIRNYLLDIVAPIGTNPHGAGAIRSFKQITDEEFFRGLCDPAQYPSDRDDPVGAQDVRDAQLEQHSEIRSFKQITDEDFFAGLSNPAQRTIL